jgi:3-oxoacyl-(acyl-carrier-protein) synthase III
MIPVRLLGTGSVLAGRRVDTLELAARAMPKRNAEEIARRIGISTRYWVEPGTTAASLATEALRRALESSGCQAKDLRRIIFVSSNGGDTLSPANAHAVTAALGLDDTCDGFDLSNACTGFLSAFDLAARSVATGLGPVAVVAAETFSRHLSADVPRSYLVMADAAGAVVLGEGRPGEGILASHLRSSSDVRGQVTVTHPTFTGKPSTIEFDATYDALADSAVNRMASSSRTVAAAAGVPIGEVEWFLPHQPNGRIMELLVERLEINPARTVPVVDEIGSVGAASIPVSLDRLFRRGGVKAGDRLLLTAVGAGTGYGALLHRVAP